MSHRLTLTLRFAFLALFAAALMVLPNLRQVDVAQAAVLTDQVSSGAGNLGGFTLNSIGQSFTPQQASISGLDVDLKNSGIPVSVHFEVHLHSTNALIGSSNSVLITANAAGTLYHFEFLPPLPLIPGTKYVLQGVNESVGNSVSFAIHNTGYAGGEFCLLGTPCTDNLSGRDAAFTTYYTTPTTLFSSSFGNRNQNPVTVDGWVDGDGTNVGVTVNSNGLTRGPTAQHLNLTPGSSITKPLSTLGYTGISLTYYCSAVALSGDLLADVDAGSGFVVAGVTTCPLGSYALQTINVTGGVPAADNNGAIVLRFTSVTGAVIQVDDVTLTGSLILPAGCVGPFDSTIEGTPGRDRLKGTAGRDLIVGHEGDDVIEGGDNNDCIDGGPGNDSIEGGDGDDVLIGGPGKDNIDGDDDNDTITGGDDDDRLDGGSGSDNLTGDDGNDRAVGGSGIDTCVAETEQECEDPGPPPPPPSDSDEDGIDDSTDNCPDDPNADQLNSDSDSDGNVCDPDDDNDGVEDETDICDPSGPLPSTPIAAADVNGDGCGDAYVGTLTVTKVVVNDTVGRFNLFIRQGTQTLYQVANRASGQSLGPVTVPAASLTVAESSGTNVSPNTFSAAIECKDGATPIVSVAAASVTFTMPAQKDIVCTITNTYIVPPGCEALLPFAAVFRGNGANNTISGTNGRDLILGGGGNDKIDGKGGDDCIDGEGGVDTIDGGSGNDIIFGGEGADTIKAGGGNDTVHGGPGDDTIDGGTENDILHGDEGTDKIDGGSSTGGTGDTCSGETRKSCETVII